MLANELARYELLVSPIRMVSLDCRSPLLKHVVCHNRQIFIVLKDKTADLNLSFNFKVDGFNYMVDYKERINIRAVQKTQLLKMKIKMMKM